MEFIKLGCMGRLVCSFEFKVQSSKFKARLNDEVGQV